MFSAIFASGARIELDKNDLKSIAETQKRLEEYCKPMESTGCPENCRCMECAVYKRGGPEVYNRPEKEEFERLTNELLRVTCS